MEGNSAAMVDLVCNFAGTQRRPEAKIKFVKVNLAGAKWMAAGTGSREINDGRLFHHFLNVVVGSEQKLVSKYDTLAKS